MDFPSVEDRAPQDDWLVPDHIEEWNQDWRNATYSRDEFFAEFYREEFERDEQRREFAMQFVDAIFDKAA